MDKITSAEWRKLSSDEKVAWFQPDFEEWDEPEHQELSKAYVELCERLVSLMPNGDTRKHLPFRSLEIACREAHFLLHVELRNVKRGTEVTQRMNERFRGVAYSGVRSSNR